MEDAMWVREWEEIKLDIDWRDEYIGNEYYLKGFWQILNGGIKRENWTF